MKREAVLRTTRRSWLPAVSMDVITEGMIVFINVSREFLEESVKTLVCIRWRSVSIASVRSVTIGSRVVFRRVSMMSGS